MEKRISKIVFFDPVIVSDVDTWVIDLDYITDEEVEEAKLYLNREEVQRAQQFVLHQHRHHFVMRRALLKIVLSQYAKIDPKVVRISYGQYRKPYLANNEHIYFNFSHTDTKGVLVVTKQGQIGIDIELIRPLEDMVGILNRIASVDEQSWVGNSLERFFILWTIKEALIKCQGTGFLIDKIPSLDQLPSKFENMFVSRHQNLGSYSRIVDDSIVSICF
jgi:4'-phosphopantetheinyl transferase